MGNHKAAKELNGSTFSEEVISYISHKRDRRSATNAETTGDEMTSIRIYIIKNRRCLLNNNLSYISC